MNYPTHPQGFLRHWINVHHGKDIYGVWALLGLAFIVVNIIGVCNYPYLGVPQYNFHVSTPAIHSTLRNLWRKTPPPASPKVKPTSSPAAAQVSDEHLAITKLFPLKYISPQTLKERPKLVFIVLMIMAILIQIIEFIITHLFLLRGIGHAIPHTLLNFKAGFKNALCSSIKCIWKIFWANFKIWLFSFAALLILGEVWAITGNTFLNASARQSIGMMVFSCIYFLGIMAFLYGGSTRIFFNWLLSSAAHNNYQKLSFKSIILQYCRSWPRTTIEFVIKIILLTIFILMLSSIFTNLGNFIVKYVDGLSGILIIPLAVCGASWIFASGHLALGSYLGQAYQTNPHIFGFTPPRAEPLGPSHDLGPASP